MNEDNINVQILSSKKRIKFFLLCIAKNGPAS